MALPAVYRRKVGRDLAGAFRWYEQQHAGLGEEFLAAANASFAAIQAFPEMFVLVHGEIRRAVMQRFPYAVFYRTEPDRLVVLAILHMARNPKLWP